MISTALTDTVVQDNEHDAPVFSRTFPASLEVFRGHYPGFPIVPGVILIESCAAVIQRLQKGFSHWTGVRSARFLNPVRPDAQVVITVTEKPRGDDTIDYLCVVTDAGKVSCTATLTYSDRYSDSYAAGEAYSDTDSLGHFDVGDIKNILPHRQPMLLVDRVDCLLAGERIVARKAISANELFHSETPTVNPFPQSLLMESWCQSAGILVSTETPNPDVLSGDVMLFAGIRGIEFHKLTYPGDVLIHHAAVDRFVEGTAVVSGQTSTNGQSVMTVGNITLARRPAVELTG